MNESFIEKMEAYLEGSISREKLQQIAEEEDIHNLEEELRWLQESRVAIEAAGLRQQLKEVLPKSVKKEAKVVRLKSIRTALAIAASVLVIVVAYLGWNQRGTNRLYAEYEYVDPGPPALMSQGGAYELNDALTYYSEGDYQSAVERLQQIESNYPNNDTLNFYLGASLLYQGQAEAARSSLSKLGTQANSRFQERADWLLVLAALREKDWERAQTLVQAILSEPEHEFMDQARSLAEDLMMK